MTGFKSTEISPKDDQPPGAVLGIFDELLFMIDLRPIEIVVIISLR